MASYYFSPSSPLLLLFSLLLLLLPPPSSAAAAAAAATFSAADSPWLPSQNRSLLSPNSAFSAGFLPAAAAAGAANTSAAAGGLFVFAVWVASSADKTVVWSLNPSDPVNSSSPLSLSLSPSALLSLPDPRGRNLFPPSNASAAPNASASASALVLHDDGRLSFESWSSFSSPTDTLLANQPLAASLRSNNGLYRLVNRSTLVFAGGSGGGYWSAPAITTLTPEGRLLMAGGWTINAADVGPTSPLRRLTLDDDGNLRIYSLRPRGRRRRWRLVWQAVPDPCSIPGACGAHAVCVPNSNYTATACVCLPGSRKDAGGLASPPPAATSNSSCVPKRSFLPASKFLPLDYVSFATDGNDYVDRSPLNFGDCESACLSDDACVGFSYMYVGNRTCLHHFGTLVGGFWSPANMMAMFVRVSAAETDRSGFTGLTTPLDTACPVRVGLLPPPPKEGGSTVPRNAAVVGVLFAAELVVGVLSFWAFLRKYSEWRDMARTFRPEFLPGGGGPKRFSYAELKAATADFSNVVGRGGYGVVYKGHLPDGRAIAVKCLHNVGNGEAEFWAEVAVIARMHHLNLVRLWGFCADKDRRMLVYEHVSNGSLDKFLFPPAAASDARPLLDWNIRYRIALGVARAVAYLHEECLEWVLHCDIKPENILLEDDFCPKVSDFGLSKLTTKKDMVTVSRIRGTRGYMAPEWVIRSEPITAKADVYSFGMVLLEIVSGRRNYEFQKKALGSEDWYFPRWAFEKVYVEKNMEEIEDPRIMESYDDTEHFAMVERMVKTAMWCVQDRAEMRPSMGKVAKMLEGSVEITEPVKPAIFCDPDE